MRYRIVFAAILAGLVLPLMARASEPHVKWTFTARSNLYTGPVVVEVPGQSGKEIIVSDSEVRRLRCVDATGKQVWEYYGGWKKRLSSTAAVSYRARPGKATLLIGNGDGTLDCLDAATGKTLWKRTVGKIEWSNAIWADLNGDGRDEVVAGSEDTGITVLDSAGKRLWNYNGHPQGLALGLRGPLAAADLDGNGKQEILALTHFGPVCLNRDGSLRWERFTGDDFNGAVVVADAEGDGKPKAYCCSSDDNALWCMDALTGQVRWHFSMLGGADTYASSAIAVGDLYGNGQQEIVAADNQGYVYCLGPDGRQRWIFATEKHTHAQVTLGDVDGDGEVEVLVTCGDHYLYCLDNRGVLKWRFAAGLRIMSPATITDVDGSGKTDILFGGSDHKLRCLTLGGRYDPARIPWPSRRFDAAQSGCSFRREPERARGLVTTTEPLFLDGGFEHAKSAGSSQDYPPGSHFDTLRAGRPRGWTCEQEGDGRWELDREVHYEGDRSLKVTPGTAPVIVATERIEVRPALQQVQASIRVRGGQAAAYLRWIGLEGTLREDALTAQGEADADGWTLLAAPEVTPPPGAHWVSLVCVSAAEPAWWDDARLTGTFSALRQARALVNQVGYDLDAPKRFTVQADFDAQKGQFELLAQDGSVVFHAALAHRGPILGAYSNDWGSDYWRGDFTAFNRPGRYRARVRLDDLTDVSWPFRVGRDLLFHRTGRPAYHLFYYQRCGMAIPGFHKACHLDDATNLAHTRLYHLVGGWHDAGDYNKNYNAPHVLGLALAYGMQKARFDREDLARYGRKEFAAEIIWGANHVCDMVLPDGSVPGPITIGVSYMGPPDIETDNIPGTGDERPVLMESGQDPTIHVAALAKVARYVDGADTRYVAAAERGVRWCVQHHLASAELFGAALDLYVVTHKPEYARLAKTLFPKVGLEDAEAARQYDLLFHTDHRAEITQRLVARAEELVSAADNPFGVFTFGPKERPNFFRTPDEPVPWHGGQNSDILQATAVVAQAYRYHPDPRYLAYVYDQFNWILGCNPFDLCMMEGAGSFHPPTYHSALTFAGVPRGAVPGSVVNGITWRAIGDDRPYFDLSGVDIPMAETNEIWLPHNKNYLIALSALMRERNGHNLTAEGPQHAR
jgi:outer membrane protein assembly factor BamB